MRIGVFADAHLDSPFRWAGPDLARQWRMRTRSVIEKIVTITVDEKLDALLCAGDLYEHEHFASDTGDFLRATFDRLGSIPLLAAPGNHDWNGPTSLYSVVEWPSNVTIFKPDRLTPVELTPGVTIWGAAHRAPRNTDGFLNDFSVDRGGVNLALFHGSEDSGLRIQGEEKKPHAPFRNAQIQTSGLNFAFVGHYHSPTEGSHHAYPGNPDPLAFSEPGTGGLMIVEVADSGSVQIERRRVSVTEVHDIAIDVSGATSSSEILERCTDSLSSIGGLVRVTLHGDFEPQVDFTLADVANLQCGPEAIVPQYGQIGVAYDLDEISRRETVEGQFVRDVSASSIDDDEKACIIATGLRALAGRNDLEIA